MPTAKLKKRKGRRAEPAAALFPRSERGVRCGPIATDRHIRKNELRRMVMRAPAEALEHFQD